MPRGLAARGIFGLPFRLVFRSHRAVARWDAVIRRALEHRDVCGLLGNDGYRLDGGGTRAYYGNAAAREVHRLMRPFAGVEGSALECLDARKIRHASRGETAGRHHDVAGNHGLAGARMHRPTRACLVEDRSVDACVEGDETAKVEPVGDMVRVA